MSFAYVIIENNGKKSVEIARDYQYNNLIDYIGRNTTETVEYVLGDNMRFSIGPYTHYKFNNNNNTCQIYSFTCENGSVYPISKNRELLCWLIGYINRVTMTTVVDECLNDSIYDSSIYHL